MQNIYDFEVFWLYLLFSEHAVKRTGKSVSNSSEDLNNVKKVIDSNSHDAGIEKAVVHNYSEKNLIGEKFHDVLIVMLASIL